ncbi:MAG: hypothetical protein ABI457_11200 [Hyphomicrobium sp.]|jgi:hypothetical protein
MALVNLSRLLAIAWVALSVWVYVLMLNGFKPGQALILAPWVAAPLPVGYWAGSQIARTPAAWTAVFGGLAVAFVMGAWLYWDAFLGRSSREESLAGLIVLVAPIYQFVVIGIALVVAALLNRPRS